MDQNERESEAINTESVDALGKVRKEKKEKKVLWVLVGIVIGLLLSIALVIGGRAFANYRYLQKVKTGNTAKTANTASEEVLDSNAISKIKLLEKSIDKYYLEEADTQKLQTGLYKGLIDALDDPYSDYYTNDELKALKEKTQGIYYGIGAYIGYDQNTNYCKITGIIPNTPAEEAGLKAEDLIVEVDGKDCQNITTSDIVTLIKGEENTVVNLTIFRKGETDYLKIPVTRRKVETPTVNYEMKDGQIAYIQITQFDDVTTNQFIEKFTQAKEDHMKGLILDLRGNPGGTLTSVVAIANQLLPEGLVVYTEDKYGKREEYICDGKNEFKLPLVVLVNENSASASEILSGAIKDYGIGTLVGTTTFGKGIVQSIYNFTDGSAVKLTISHYYTPKGNDIHKVGIKPDVEVELDVDQYLKDGTDNQLNKALEILKGKIQE